MNYEMTKDQIKSLPIEVQNHIASTLRCFDRCYVSYNYGKFSVSSGFGIYATYAPDHKEYGWVSADKFYTPEERILNYVNSFHDYPIQYKGRRDYRMIRQMNDDRSLVAKFDENGNIKF